jgi:hypothetical protein
MTNEKNTGNKRNNGNKTSDIANITLQDLEKITIAESLTFTANTLFSLLKQAEVEFEKVKTKFNKIKTEFNSSKTEFDNSKLELNKADYRKKWIEGIIDLKYRRTIDDFYKRASEYIKEKTTQREKEERIQKKEDKCLYLTKNRPNEDKPNEDKSNEDKHNEDMLIYYIPDIDNKDNMIKVEFYKEKSDISGQMQVKKRFSLVKRNNKQGGYDE